MMQYCMYQSESAKLKRNCTPHQAALSDVSQSTCRIVNAFEECDAATFDEAGVRHIVLHVDVTSATSRLSRDGARVLSWGDDAAQYDAYKPKGFLLAQHRLERGVERLVGTFRFDIPKKRASSQLHFEFGPTWTLISLDPWLGSRPLSTRHNIKPPKMTKVMCEEHHEGHPRKGCHNGDDVLSDAEHTVHHGAPSLEATSGWVRDTDDVANIANENIFYPNADRSRVVHANELNVVNVWDVEGDLHVWVSCEAHIGLHIALEADGTTYQATQRHVKRLAPHVCLAQLVFACASMEHAKGRTWSGRRLFLVSPGKEKKALDIEREVERRVSDKCVLCSRRPANATFVHGTTGHKVCCIECAAKITAPSVGQEPAPCPVCRAPIDRVIETFE